MSALRQVYFLTLFLGEMIKLLFKLPRKVTVACSGGVDSMALVDFLKRSHEITLAFFHHGTENSEQAFRFLSEWAHDNSIELLVGYLTSARPSELSLEEFWRQERYKFLESIPGVVVTAHHLDDVIETWIWSCLHGTPKLIPSRRNNIMRPLLTTPKKELVEWCQRKNVEWVEDSSNVDIRFMRNFIRAELLPKALVVNPGLAKIISKKIYTREKNSI